MGREVGLKRDPASWVSVLAEREHPSLRLCCRALSTLVWPAGPTPAAGLLTAYKSLHCYLPLHTPIGAPGLRPFTAGMPWL